VGSDQDRSRLALYLRARRSVGALMVSFAPLWSRCDLRLSVYEANSSPRWI
jgi:hypothetical protein